MGIFLTAALVGFLLFGWIGDKPWVRVYFRKQWVQLTLTLLPLVLLVSSVWVLITLPALWVVEIAQGLTGPEVAQLILGVAFGCVLRYWGPLFWVISMPPGRRYNWVAISLVGLILLAAAAPYIERQLEGMTAIKTSVAEFQFSGATRGRVNHYIIEESFGPEKVAPYFAVTLFVRPDLDYFSLFPSAKSERLKKIYNKSRKFGETYLDPLNECAVLAYHDYLDIESIRHALSPVAQQLRLLIKAERSQNSASSEKLSIDSALTKIKESVNRLVVSFFQDKDLPLKEIEEAEKNVKHLKILVQNKPPLLMEVEKSLDMLKNAIGYENKACNFKFPWKTKDEELFSDLSSYMADAPHLYLTLALFDEYNDNPDGAISIMKQASARFDARDLGPSISFYINYVLGLLLRDSEHDPESIFPYFDEALEIAQATLGKIDERRGSLDRDLKIGKDTCEGIDRCEQITSLQDQVERLDRVKKSFELAEIFATNALAYVSANKRVRKFRAIIYAEQNYNIIEKLTEFMRPRIIDTYGYVKMTFAVKEIPPDFDEIERAKALFHEARNHIRRIEDRDRHTIEIKRFGDRILRSHLEQANRLLENR